MKKTFIILLGLWLLLSTAFVTIISFQDQIVRARVGMGWGLIIFWIFICGAVMFRFRDKIRAAVSRLTLSPVVKFTVFATILALVEEAITTSMTNLAPLWGFTPAQAHITASANFFDVVFFHSVILFIPMFFCWGLLLKRYRFSPFAVFLLFGITGTLAESSTGHAHLLEFGLWIFVYGLMVYLPAYAVEFPATRTPKIWHYVIAIILPLLFVVLTGWIPEVLGHPATHF